MDSKAVTMAKLRAPLELLVSVGFGLLTGLVVSLVMVYNLITKGPRKVFYCKEHETRPKCFHDAKVGNHGFVTLKVRFEDIIAYIYFGQY